MGCGLREKVLAQLKQEPPPRDAMGVDQPMKVALSGRSYTTERDSCPKV